MPLKIAIIGAGNIGKLHAEVCDKIEYIKIVGIVDNDEVKGRSLANNYKTKFYLDLDSILRKENLDIAAICTPTYLHAGMVEKIANAKVNIFCEKPLALSLEEADKMIKAVKKNKVKAMVGHVLKYWPEYCRTRDIINSRILGKPLTAQCERLCPMHIDTKNSWKIKKEMSGGAALDVQIHDLDYLIWLFGKPTLIKSIGKYNHKLAGWIHIYTFLKFKDNIIGLVSAGWHIIKSYPFTMTLRVICEKGVIEWIYKSTKGYEGRNQKFPLVVYKSDGSSFVEKVEQTDPYYKEWIYFIDCIINNKEIDKSSLEIARTSLSITLESINSCNNHNY